MNKLSKTTIYQKLYNGNVNKIDKNLSTFIKHKKTISKQYKHDPIEFEY